jgi:CMP-N-acetylneuraminic acid synthetase/spore coat polysaccharide biosynthesis predicted glycosyltransferase SpsG
MTRSQHAERPLLAIVPARGGSKEIPRKNMRMIGGRPLLAYTLDALENAGLADRVVVSSEDEQILRWAEERGHEARPRAVELASDEATISDVAAALADELDWQGDVGVFQPTAPLRRADSVRAAVRHFRESGADSLASCVRENHLYWYDEHDDLGRAEPLFAERVSRQFARPRVLRETGSIQLVRAEALRTGRQIVTDHHLLLELGHDESLDIDTYEDLDAARRIVEQGTVIFRLRANARIGSGHLYHCLQLAEELRDQRLRFLLHECDPFVGAHLEERGYVAVNETDLANDLATLAGPGSNLIVNDVLDTTEREVLIERATGFSVVNIEDLGRGARFADWVVNALYPVDSGAPEHFSWGGTWATLRDEFFHLPPKPVREQPERLLITFGGTDAAGLGRRCAGLLAGRCGVDIRVIVGPGADDQGFPDGVTVTRHTRNMAAEMREADLILTSGGRTVYEAAATGTPVAVLGQNAREATHAHLNYSTGVVFLGIGPLVDDDHIVAVVQRMLSDAQLRTELSQRLRCSIDSAGAARIAHRIRGMLKGL